MHKSFHAEPIAAFEALIHDAARRGDTPAAILQHASASNDASCESPANCGDDCDDSDSWARHALAANGFGGASATDAGTAMRPVDSPPLRPARVYRSFALKALIAAAIRGARSIAYRAYARHRQRRQMKSIGDLLRDLDDHTLRDLGFHRSEISSVAAEMVGAAECTRVRVELALCKHPGARRS